jgi:hypothetical protein
MHDPCNGQVVRPIPPGFSGEHWTDWERADAVQASEWQSELAV